MSAPATCEQCGRPPMPACELFGIAYPAERLHLLRGFVDQRDNRGFIQPDEWLCPGCYYAALDEYDTWDNNGVLWECRDDEADLEAPGALTPPG